MRFGPGRKSGRSDAAKRPFRMGGVAKVGDPTPQNGNSAWEGSQNLYIGNLPIVRLWRLLPCNEAPRAEIISDRSGWGLPPGPAGACSACPADGCCPPSRLAAVPLPLAIAMAFVLVMWLVNDRPKRKSSALTACHVRSHGQMPLKIDF